MVMNEYVISDSGGINPAQMDPFSRINPLFWKAELQQSEAKNNYAFLNSYWSSDSEIKKGIADQKQIVASTC